MASRTEPKRTNVPGISFVRALDWIEEYRLDKNGLQILLVPDSASPVAGVMVTYHVGSRNEAIGYTGATHLLEHLMFKGSKHFNKKNGGDAFALLERKGARVNATTWNDRTNYYEVLPRALVPTALALEADRMRNAYLRETDRVSEMPVVRNEFEIGENNPAEALDKQLWALAYQAHPYHHSTIGWKSDIERVPIERLQKFYADFYRPDNATVTVAGGFDVKEVLACIKKEFGAHIAPSAPLPELYTTEPRQEGERRVMVRRASDSNLVAIAHKIPGASHGDVPALLLLSLILADGKASRLYRALVDTSQATDVTTICYQLRDPSLLSTLVTLTPGTGHDRVEQTLKAEFARICTEGIAAKEIAKARQSLRAYIASRSDGPYALLSSLNEEIATGDWTRFVTFPEALARVTAREVQAVAKKYLVDDQSTVGHFVGTRL
ncbi:insulinase family protein [Candidatus Kaiserbacteria bacterium CG10_big_fil_rev_8_21_14_0_10_56_12]|uniref:Insulinase family protein n=1 Tax=Candidatus Kaiserbacteria bacterium CG10_big_fil_rev_8_21_14_0_10_56_12 TaxID=1974611 RepID=A0A2H0UBW7_9BACT|nr:MAG: insulinase family protein [Candidatus Kaiserbacteria bacterium CG10_big_fil_rev_8_21_14_0_10_56_12]